MLDFGGPIFQIKAGGRIYLFEMHPYCGPVWIKKNGDARKNQPEAFLEAVTHWNRQGRRVENGLCKWTKPERLL